MLQHGVGGFERIALPAVRLEQGEADIRMVQFRARVQSADADRRAVAKRDMIGPEPVFRVAQDRTLGDGFSRLLARLHAAVADVADKIRVRPDGEHQVGIV